MSQREGHDTGRTPEAREASDALRRRVADLERELADADERAAANGARAAELEAEIARLKARTECAYCGYEVDADDAAGSVIARHIKTCPRHPIRDCEQRVKALEAEVARLKNPPRGRCGMRSHRPDCECRGEGGDR